MNHAKLKKKKSSRLRYAGAELIVSGIFDNWMHLLFIILYSLLTDGIVNGII